MKQSRKTHIALLVFSLVASLALAEVLLRLVQVPGKIRSGWAWEDSPRRFLAQYGNDEPNELGFRGQPIRYDKKDYVVVLLGDSQVEAVTSPPERMPEQLLQKHLSAQLKRPVKVFSLAASGFGQDQQLLALERYYRQYRADLVLVWATPDNDCWENAFPDRSTTSTAGHLKPTYKLVNNALQGPYYQSDFYYHHSALLQLVVKAYARSKGMSVEQMILNRWVKELPASHEVFDKVNLNESSEGLLAIGQKEYAENLDQLNPEWRFMLLTSEDYYNSRSHFSPFLVNRSPRDNYLVSISAKLYGRIADTAKRNGSKFKVFLPNQTSNPRSDQLLVKSVQNLWEGRAAREVVKDEAALLKGLVPGSDLIMVDLPGGAELSFSNKDRHLSDIGNDRAMKNLASLLGDQGGK